MKLKKVFFYERKSKYRLEESEDSVDGYADMLRYDTAFVSDAHPGIVAFPVFATKYGNAGGRVTEGRWSSFGYRVTRLNADKEAEMKFSNFTPELWYTMMHPAPRKNHGRDYGRLVRVTLAEYFKAKEFDELGIEAA
jgi:hypothetical protein